MPGQVKPLFFVGEECLVAAREAMEIEARAVQEAAGRLNQDLPRAAAILLKHRGKIIVTGVGKSALVGKKIVATLSSTGMPAVFLHATDAIHGDVGVYAPGDPTIVLSKSGSTAELQLLVPILRRCESPLIGILGNMNSPLARQVDVALDASVRREADPLNLVPTASTTVALAVGDALVAALMHARGFTTADFHRLHPGGQLGRNLGTRVAQVMHPLPQVARLGISDSLRQAVIAISHAPLGAGCVIDDECRLLGLVTDGDVRRALQMDGDILAVPVARIMTSKPVTVGPDESLGEALRRMEDRPSQLSVLPVVDNLGVFVGLLRLHDVYQASSR